MRIGRDLNIEPERGRPNTYSIFEFQIVPSLARQPVNLDRISESAINKLRRHGNIVQVL